MKISRKIGIIVFLLVGGLLCQSCERADQESWSDDGANLVTEPSDRLQILDSLVWNYQNHVGDFYYFDNPGTNVQYPGNGDYVVYSDELIDICGQLASFQQDAGFVILELVSVPINPFFKFFAYSDTIRTLGNGYQEELDSLAIFRNDTLVIENASIPVKDANFVRGVINVANLSIYELGVGEQFFYMSPEWENGIVTRDAQIEWNQDLEIHGNLSYTANDRDEFKDSMLLRKRTYRKFTAQFPVETVVEEWLVFEWHLPGTDFFELEFTIAGESDLLARFQQKGEWSLKSSTDLNTENLNLRGWDRLKSGYLNLEFNTIVTPVFGGLSDLHLTKKLQLNVVAEAAWPNWQIEGGINHYNSVNSSAEVLNDLPEGQFDTELFAKSVLSQAGELENETPVAHFTISPPTGFTNNDFKLNGRSSSDKEDDLSLLQIRWDLNGDGFWETAFSTEKIQIQGFPNAGTRNIIMEVMDTQGASSLFSRQLVVHETSSAPIASFSVSPEAGKQSELFTFDASGCYDAEDPLSVLEVRWDFKNDGEWDTHFTTVKARGWFFGEPGEFVVKLEVRDSDGLTGSTTKLVRVSEGNIKPIAYFTAFPESGTTETNFVFDAGESSDTEDAVEDLQVRWDFENDGAWDTEYRTIKSVNHQFTTAGSFEVLLEVQDTEGFVNVFSRIIEVSNPNTPPTADFTFSPDSGDINTKFLFDASSSFDLEDDISLLEVRWDFENDNIYDTEFSTVKTISKQFSEPGTKLVKVQVRDSGGLLATKVDYLIVIE